MCVHLCNANATFEGALRGGDYVASCVEKDSSFSVVNFIDVDVYMRAGDETACKPSLSILRIKLNIIEKYACIFLHMA